jgi:hypothetical protein
LGLSLVKLESALLLTARTAATVCAPLLFCCGGFGGGVGVFLGEAFDAAGSVQKLLLAGEEGVAIGTDFNVQPVPFDGGAGLEVVAASAVDGYSVIVGMNTGLHESPFCRGRSAPKPAEAGSTEASLGREVTPYYSGGSEFLQKRGEGVRKKKTIDAEKEGRRRRGRRGRKNAEDQGLGMSAVTSLEKGLSTPSAPTAVTT